MGTLRVVSLVLVIVPVPPTLIKVGIVAAQVPFASVIVEELVPAASSVPVIVMAYVAVVPTTLVRAHVALRPLGLASAGVTVGAA
jgi:hypothetical protein